MQTSNVDIPKTYEFIREIGAGGFGAVHEWKEKASGVHYAAKIIRLVSNKDEQRIDREVVRLRHYVHPQIVFLKEVLPMSNARAIVMELGQQALSDFVSQHKERHSLVPREIVYRIMIDVSSALSFMHNHPTGQASHGDIKMENILLFPNGHAKLCDLGAGESANTTSLGERTCLYMSPERIDDESSHATPASDVWSLGVILFELLNGKPLFTTTNTPKQIRDIAAFKTSSIGNECGEDERILLTKLLDTNPGSRIRSEQLMDESVLRCLLNTTDAVWKLREMEKNDNQHFTFGDQRWLEPNQVVLHTMGMVLANLPIWMVTDALLEYDSNSHTLSGACLVQIGGLGEWRTAFSFPITDGVWELCVNLTDSTLPVTLGYIEQPRPANAFLCQAGSFIGEHGGDFVLWNGSRWKGGSFLQGVPNDIPQPGQMVAIRVNMIHRVAHLLIDNKEQPGMFINLPCPLSLAISTGFTREGEKVEIAWMKRVDCKSTTSETPAILHNAHQQIRNLQQENDQLVKTNISTQQLLSRKDQTIRSIQQEKDQLGKELQNERAAIWVGTTSLTQPWYPSKLPSGEHATPYWKTSFTFPLGDGEWELKIKLGPLSDSQIYLGFHSYPLPRRTAEITCGSYFNGFGGDFDLWDGAMGRGGRFIEPAGTNKSCNSAGQTAAIRINFETREVRLFVDEEEQPGIFTCIQPINCLGISTTSKQMYDSLKVLWLKRFDGGQDTSQSRGEFHQRTIREITDGLPIRMGIDSLTTFDKACHGLINSTLFQKIELRAGEWRTAYTFGVETKEWELKIKISHPSDSLICLGFLKHPLPQDATAGRPGASPSWNGGHFNLMDGSVWQKGKEICAQSTYRRCYFRGQTAAIRVNMKKREARLFMDDEEQPGIISRIPSHVSLAISTGSRELGFSVEVLWMKKIDPGPQI
ncbi:putative Carbon catabolite-derepressing protein kinase [Blattamonas nauphoetae]|uniref:Carbon catabolite-derepressing protein kinase n=1 Tax=Blattamonas nauphoetae TaxID=2049346 RepID=A0ABQ9X476_9EUKA|nr:putative Carbon catabolite-derepressing protein kinase [Blattamonas nauphoetae]